MTATTVVVQGRVRSDGTLELEGKVPLPAGRVSVTLQPIPYSQETDPLFVMLRGIWAAREQAGKSSRTGEEAQAALHRLRDEVADEVAEVGQLQKECRKLREADERGEEAG